MPQEQEAEHLAFRRLWKPKQTPKTQDADWRRKHSPLLLLGLWHSWRATVTDCVTTCTHMRVMSWSTLSMTFPCCLSMIFIKVSLPTGYGDRFQWLSVCLSNRRFWVLSPVPQIELPDLLKRCGRSGLICVIAICCTHREWEPLSEKEEFPFSLTSCHKSSLHGHRP